MTDVVVPSPGVKFEDMGVYSSGATLPPGWLYVFSIDGGSLSYTSPSGTVYTIQPNAGSTIMVHSDGTSWKVTSGNFRVLRLKL